MSPRMEVARWLEKAFDMHSRAHMPAYRIGALQLSYTNLQTWQAGFFCSDADMLGIGQILAFSNDSKNHEGNQN
jgi:hypothetical protein